MPMGHIAAMNKQGGSNQAPSQPGESAPLSMFGSSRQGSTPALYGSGRSPSRYATHPHPLMRTSQPPQSASCRQSPQQWQSQQCYPCAIPRRAAPQRPRSNPMGPLLSQPAFIEQQPFRNPAQGGGPNVRQDPRVAFDRNSQMQMQYDELSPKGNRSSKAPAPPPLLFANMSDISHNSSQPPMAARDFSYQTLVAPVGMYCSNLQEGDDVLFDEVPGQPHCASFPPMIPPESPAMVPTQSKSMRLPADSQVTQQQQDAVLAAANTAQQLSKRCDLCASLLAGSSVISTACGHTYHEACLEDYTKQLIKRGVDNLRCPQCMVPMDVNAILAITSNLTSNLREQKIDRATKSHSGGDKMLDWSVQRDPLGAPAVFAHNSAVQASGTMEQGQPASRKAVRKPPVVRTTHDGTKTKTPRKTALQTMKLGDAVDFLSAEMQHHVAKLSRTPAKEIEDGSNGPPGRATNWASDYMQKREASLSPASQARASASNTLSKELGLVSLNLEANMTRLQHQRMCSPTVAVLGASASPAADTPTAADTEEVSPAAESATVTADQLRLEKMMLGVQSPPGMDDSRESTPPSNGISAEVGIFSAQAETFTPLKTRGSRNGRKQLTTSSVLAAASALAGQGHTDEEGIKSGASIKPALATRDERVLQVLNAKENGAPLSRHNAIVSPPPRKEHRLAQAVQSSVVRHDGGWSANTTLQTVTRKPHSRSQEDNPNANTPTQIRELRATVARDVEMRNIAGAVQHSGGEGSPPMAMSVEISPVRLMGMWNNENVSPTEPMRVMLM